MDLKQLENIIAISEEQSISRAAERLFISQPALSQQLTKLETQLGTPLFYRGNRYLTLTPAGTIYVQNARRILAVREETYSKIQKLSTADTHAISVGISSGRCPLVVSNVYPKFSEAYPHVSIQTIDHPFPMLESMLLSGKLNLIFSLISDEELAAGIPFSHISLTQEPIHLAVSKQHPLAPQLEYANKAHRGVNLAAFQNESFAMSQKKSKIRLITEKIFATNSFHPTILYEIFSLNAVCSVVERSNLCTLLPVGYLPRWENLVHAPIIPAHFTEFSLCWNSNHTLSTAEQHFIALCQEYCQQNIYTTP